MTVICVDDQAPEGAEQIFYHRSRGIIMVPKGGTREEAFDRVRKQTQEGVPPDMKTSVIYRSVEPSTIW